MSADTTTSCRFMGIVPEPEEVTSVSLSFLCSPVLEEDKENQKVEENKENQEVEEDMKLMSSDEERREREFWHTPSPFTPESRLEAHRHLEEKRKAKEK